MAANVRPPYRASRSGDRRGVNRMEQQQERLRFVPGRVRVRRPKAVVCEDNKADARLAGLVLGVCGYEVVAEARLASEAVQLAAVWQPDVVILDVHLLG